VEADRMMEHPKRSIKRMEDAKTSSIQRFKELPGNATIRKEYVKCGRDSCVNSGMRNVDIVELISYIWSRKRIFRLLFAVSVLYQIEHGS
jgi:hypothetical protein